MRTGCRAAGPMSATAPSSTCRSPRARSRRWSPAPSSTRSRSRSRRSPRARWKAICRDCAGTIEFAGRTAAGPAGQGRHGPGLPGGRRAVPVARARSSCPAAARTGRTCASMSRRCSTASAPGSTRSRSFSSCCAAWMKTNCSPAPEQDLPLAQGAPSAAKVLDDGDVAALFGLEMAEAPEPRIRQRSKPPPRTPRTKPRNPAAKKKWANEMKGDPLHPSKSGRQANRL